jgi:hypothetical protein
MTYEDFEPGRIKHLEMIQLVVSRLGTDSFLVKGWAVTLNAALLGFAISGEDWRLAAVAVIPTLALWQLDTYYLRAERLFRHLYEAVRTGSPAVEPFYMGATAASFLSRLEAATPDAVSTWWAIACSRTISIFFGVLAAIAIALSAVLGVS